MTGLLPPLLDGVTCGDCRDVMKAMPSRSADFILTDPPYLVRYVDRSGRSVRNDDNDAWLEPAFIEMHRVLKSGRFCVSFYAWNKADLFLRAWRKAGFSIVGHVVFTKEYASSTRFMRYQHEQAYLLAKGSVVRPTSPPPDVIRWTNTGNRLHPTEKPVGIFRPLIEAFTKPGDTVLDPFCGSGSTLVAAQHLGRRIAGIEIDPAHHRTASVRLASQRGNALTIASRFNHVADATRPHAAQETARPLSREPRASGRQPATCAHPKPPGFRP